MGAIHPAARLPTDAPDYVPDYGHTMTLPPLPVSRKRIVLRQ